MSDEETSNQEKIKCLYCGCENHCDDSCEECLNCLDCVCEECFDLETKSQ